MVVSNKIVWILIVLTSLLMELSSCTPAKENSKIRIHIPVKHHTHIHTKTLVKKIAVPVPVPIKEEHHYHKEEDDDDSVEDFEEYIPQKKKRYRYHPFS